VTVVDHELRIKELLKTKRGHMSRLDAGTVGMLRSWRARQAEKKLLLGAAYEDRNSSSVTRTAGPTNPIGSAGSFSASRSSGIRHALMNRCLAWSFTGSVTRG
jgi:hypothetical protein